MKYTRLAPADDPVFLLSIAHVQNLLRQLPEPFSAAGISLLNEISTQNWHLEWNLPCWIGRFFKIKNEATDLIILGNIFGLGFVRLQDGFTDEESGLDIETIRVLQSFLFNAWLNQYKTLFKLESVFWNYFEQFLGQWSRSEYETGGPVEAELVASLAEPPEELDSTTMFFARRGAPLKNCCVATCLLSNQVSTLPLILQGCDNLVAGMVLVDHAQDWREDLYAGRYNAFQSFLGCLPQRQGIERRIGGDQTMHLSWIEGEMIEQIYTGSKTQGYFELAVNQFHKAKETFQILGLMKLVNYCAWIEDETTRFQNRQKKSVRLMFKLAADELMQSGIR